MWNVSPFASQAAERRVTERRAGALAVYAGTERRCGRERRMRTATLMTPGLEGGWLCFEQGDEKRRLTPIPAGWDGAPDAQLEELFQSARPVTRRPATLR